MYFIDSILKATRDTRTKNIVGENCATKFSISYHEKKMYQSHYYDSVIYGHYIILL